MVLFRTWVFEPYPKWLQEWLFIDDSCLMMLLLWMVVSFLPHGLKSARKHVDQPQKPEMSTQTAPLQRGSRNDQQIMFHQKNVEITEKMNGNLQESREVQYLNDFFMAKMEKTWQNYTSAKAPWPVESAIFHCHSFERTKLGSLPVVTVRVTRKPRQVGCRLGSHKMTLWTVRKGLCSSTIRINRCCISCVQMFRQKYQVYPSISSPSRVRLWESPPSWRHL